MATFRHVSLFNCIRFFLIIVLSGFFTPTNFASAKTLAQDISPFAKHRPTQSLTSQNLTANADIPAITATNLLQDPSFEASFGNNLYWNQSSTNYGTPLCPSTDPDTGCGNGGGTAGPHTGSAWGWFGGTLTDDTGSISQSVTFPSGPANLEFYLWIGFAAAGSDTADVFTAKIDGSTVFSANATQISSYSSYTLVSIDVSAYANGATRTVTFSSVTTGQLVTFNLDDVALLAQPPTLFTISGNAGIGGVTLSYTDGTPKAATADGAGLYSFMVPSGWSGTITPSKTGYTFSPGSKSYTNVLANQTAQNYTAIPTTYTISGNTSIGGATLRYTDGTPKIATADGAGLYSFTVSSGWSGTVTPYKGGYAFTPGSKSYTNVLANQTNQNYTASPGVSWIGTTSRGHPMSFVVSPSGSQWSTFTLKTDATVGPCSVLLETTIVGPGAITNGQFSQSGSFAFTGQFTSPSTASGTYRFTNHPVFGCGNLTQSGTWTANLLMPPSNGADTTGVFRPSNGLLYLKNTNSTGIADVAINYGMGGDYPVTGDWDGDGDATIGIYRNGSFYLKNANTIGFADLVFTFGQVGDQPIAGDWNGDGVDTIGVYQPSTGQFLLRNSNSAGAPEMSFYLGNVGDVGIAGDWNGDGVDTTGVFRPSNGIIFLKNTNVTGFADIALNYGIPGDQPVTGDWNNDGVDTIGVYRNATFYLRNSNDVGFADLIFGLGNPGDMPIAGNWDGLP